MPSAPMTAHEDTSQDWGDHDSDDTNHPYSRRSAIGPHTTTQHRFLANRNPTGKAKSDKRYEDLNMQHAIAYNTFRNVMQLWDKPLFLIGTIFVPPNRKSRSNSTATHYFCNIDGYQSQNIGVMAPPSAVVPLHDTLTQGQRVVVRLSVTANRR